jgi:hypothetical protein
MEGGIMARGQIIKDERKRKTIVKHVRFTPEENELFERVKRDTGSDTDASGFRMMLTIINTILDGQK